MDGSDAPDWHAKQHDCKNDPAQADDVDQVAEAAEGECGGAQQLAPPQH